MHLTLHLTGACNFRCRYCYAGSHEGGNMTVATARAAIDLALRDQEGRNLGVIFFGGEPLLRRDLIGQIMRHTRALSAATGQAFHYKITTNGSLLDEAFLTNEETREIFVALSLDGVQAAHDAHRIDASGMGTFALVEQRAGLLLKHRPYAPVMSVVNPDTVEHYAESVRFLFEKGFRYLIFSLNYAAPWTERDLERLERQYRRIAEWYEAETLRESKFYFSPFEVKIASHVRPGSCTHDRCELGQKQVSIAPDGGIYPCVQFVGDPAYRIGEVRTGIDETRRQDLYTRAVSEKEPCARCAIRGRCNHFCGCLNRQATGDIQRVSPVLCAHERIVLPIADRLAERLYKQRSALFIQKHYNDYFPLLSLAEDQEVGRKS
ncbi:MAG: radical SAM protein [Chthoniobacteraceae bacterium]